MSVWMILLVSLLFLAALWLPRVSVGESKLDVPDDSERFPTVSGSNLDREELEFPRDFAGDLNLVIVPFEQRQQLDVNTWIPLARELEATYEGFVYYETPTIYQLPALSRTFINEGMRAGIPDQTSRERTVTLYLDKDAFKQSLGIDSEEIIHIFLCDAEGVIIWRTMGVYSEANAAGLLQAVEENLNPAS